MELVQILYLFSLQSIEIMIASLTNYFSIQLGNLSQTN